MLVNTFFREYLKSPFFWWGSGLLVIITFDANIISNQILQALVIHQLYIPILFGTLTIAFIISTYPIRKGLKEYSRAHDRKTRFVIGTQLFLIFMLQGVYFLIDTQIASGKLWPGAISDQLEFNFIINFNMLTQFIILPIIFYYNFHTIKSRLAKEGYKIDDKLRNNLGSVLYSVGVGIGAVIVIRLIIWIGAL